LGMSGAAIRSLGSARHPRASEARSRLRSATTQATFRLRAEARALAEGTALAEGAAPAGVA